jgi:hypothetical protein
VRKPAAEDPPEIAAPLVKPEQVHPEDRRNNRVELSLAPMYFYDGSSSSYSFRNFTTQGPGLGLQADLWFTPTFGMHGDYKSSLAASVTSPAAKQTVKLGYQSVEVGPRFRKHFGLSRKASSLLYGVDYVVYDASVPGSIVDRVSTTTSGLSLSLQAGLPSSISYQHFIGVELQPKLIHSEKSSANIHAGGSNETNAVGAWLGGEWIFDRTHQMFWKAQHRIEQNRFDGTASTLDPETGTIPQGSTVTNSLTIFSIGYRWGS